MKFLRCLYEEYGLVLFFFLFLGLAMVISGIVCQCSLGTESCIHFLQSGDFCSYCGDQLREYCPSCGSLVSGDSFCGSCGFALK